MWEYKNIRGRFKIDGYFFEPTFRQYLGNSRATGNEEKCTMTEIITH